MTDLEQFEGVSRHQQVRETLRQEIIAQSMKPGQQVATERELAERFGVSRFTVCRALSALVQEGMLVRQQGKGTFVANRRERLTVANTHTIALAIPLLSHMRMPAEVVKGVSRALTQKDYRLVFADTRDSATAEVQEIEKLRREKVDGLIIWPSDIDQDKVVFRELLYTGPPFVLVDRFFEDIPTDFVATDNAWGAYQATKALIGRGHRRIAHLTAVVTTNTTVLHRRQGYEKALADHGIQVDPNLVCPPVIRESGINYKHTIAFLRQEPEPITAIFSLNDAFAWAAYHALQELGLNVPGDVEIATFFDETEEMDGMDIPFVRVVQAKYEMGLRAGEILLDRIEGVGGCKPVQVFLKPTIIDLKSTPT